MCQSFELMLSQVSKHADYGQANWISIFYRIVDLNFLQVKFGCYGHWLIVVLVWLCLL